MLERFYLIWNVLITLRFLTLCASVGNKKGSVLLMHGVTMKFIEVHHHKKNSQKFIKPKTSLTLLEQPNTCLFPDRIKSTPFRPIHSKLIFQNIPHMYASRVPCRNSVTISLHFHDSSISPSLIPRPE